VGSYYNMLIKRALLLTRKPKVIFLHSEKIENGSFQPRKCFAVCDESTGSWTDVIKSQPIALVTSAKTEEAAKDIGGRLKECGLAEMDSNWTIGSDAKPHGGGDPPGIITLIAYNDLFRQMFTIPLSMEQRPVDLAQSAEPNLAVTETS
jgi:hypothetical protein